MCSEKFSLFKFNSSSKDFYLIFSNIKMSFVKFKYSSNYLMILLLIFLYNNFNDIIENKVSVEFISSGSDFGQYPIESQFWAILFEVLLT